MSYDIYKRHLNYVEEMKRWANKKFNEAQIKSESAESGSAVLFIAQGQKEILMELLYNIDDELWWLMG